MVGRRKVIKKKKVKLSKTGEVLSRAYPWLTVHEIGALSSGGYFDTEGVLHNSEGCVRCTSMVKSTGRRCKNFSVPGETMCHQHGGTLARAKAGKARVYSAFIQDPTLKKIYENIQGDETVAGIQEELSLLRALLGKVISSTSGSVDIKELKDLSAVIGEIRQLVNDCTKAEVRLGQLIDIGKVTIIIGQLVKIIQRYVSDKDVLEKIANEFDSVVWPAPLASTPQPESRKPVRKISGQTS